MSWIRCTKSKPCVICGKPDWCGFTSDGVSRCMRVMDVVPGYERFKTDINGGTVYKPDGLKQETYTYQKKIAVKPKPVLSFLSANMKFKESLTDARLKTISEQLNIESEFLKDVGIGWCAPQQAYTFPMSNQNMEIVGIRTRHLDGSKRAIKGSRQGIFMTFADARIFQDPIVVCEGPTDTAALLQLGFNAIGRPSALGGREILLDILKDREVVIVSDNDGAGRKGAEDLARSLDRTASSTIVIEPPAKDARAWLKDGATKQSFMYLIDNADKDVYAKPQIQNKSA